MRNKKMLAILVLAGVMLLSLIVALPAKAAGTFTVTDESTGSHVSGNAGDTLTFSGIGFQTGETVDINIISIDGVPYTGDNPAITVDNIDGSGVFISVPNVEANGGQYLLEAVGETSGASAETTFTILPCIVLSIDSGPVGTSVSVVGHGFTSGIENDLAASWDGGDLTAIIDSYDASTGHFTAHFDVPAAVDGAHTVTFLETDGSDPPIIITSASAPFTIGIITPLPEYPLGGLIALFAVFASFALYVKRKSLPTLHLSF